MDNELWTLNIGYCLVALNFVWKCKSKKRLLFPFMWAHNDDNSGGGNKEKCIFSYRIFFSADFFFVCDTNRSESLRFSQNAIS